MVRGGPLLFPRWPTGAGWEGSHGNLDIERSGESWWRWPPYLSLPLLLPPRASAATAFYFHSTLRGRERRRRAGGCLGFWARSPWSSEPRRAESRQALKAHTPYSPNTPEHFRPRRDVHTRILALRDVRTESLDVSLPRLSRGTLWSQKAHTLLHRCLLCSSFPTHFQYCSHRHSHICAHALVHTAVATVDVLSQEEIWVMPTWTPAHTQM